jgi:hypothetical protein
LRLHVTHVFPCTPDEFIAILQEPDFEALLARTSGVARTLLSESVQDGCVHKRVACVPDRPLPAVVQSLIGSDRLRYEQVTVLDPARRKLSWRILPEKVGNRVEIQGEMEVRPHPQGCERVVTGTVDVQVRLVGGQIEKGVVADVERSYQRSYEAVRDYIASRPRGA